LPLEVVNSKIYNHQTEIFFIGKLFSSLNLSKGIENFRYHYIIDKMCNKNPELRYKNFKDVLDDVSNGEFSHMRFTQEAKDIYQKFASSLRNSIMHLNDSLKMERDSHKIISYLSETLRVSSFEDIIQDNKMVIDCFLNQEYSYSNPPAKYISYEDVRKFHELFSSLSLREQQILLDNLQIRLEQIHISRSDGFDDVPF
jgi:serine/threonine-protein kinase